MWLQRHWEVGEGMGLIVREAYERLQIETGLSGNVFLRDYKTYKCLATHFWYKVFWQYLLRFGVRLEIGDGYDVPLVREQFGTTKEYFSCLNSHMLMASPSCSQFCREIPARLLIWCFQSSNPLLRTLRYGAAQFTFYHLPRSALESR
jgi:hypothetical protein